MSSKFSDIKIFRLENQSGSKLLARGSVVIGELVRVNFSILDGQNGKFVMLPSEKSNKVDETTGKPKYFALAQMVDKDLTAELNKVVLAEFEKGGKSSSTSGTKKATKDGIPF